MEEQRTRDEATELRMLLEKYLNAAQTAKSQPNGQGGRS